MERINKVIIQSSSRLNGNTQTVVNYLLKIGNFDVINLINYKIGHYDYHFENKGDDFRGLFKDIVKKYDTIIFATPIYWYSMSGLLKVFLDRISDFLSEEKEYGRMMRGKNMAVISCGSDDELFDGFLMPFAKSAEYLGMNFKGHLHTWIEPNGLTNDIKSKVREFSGSLI